MASSGPFVSISETAELWGTTERFVRACVARGEISGYRIGSRLIRLNRAEVEAFVRPIPTAKVGGNAHQSSLDEATVNGGGRR